MPSIRHRTVMFAAAFALAAGFAGSAAAQRNCSICTGIYDHCMAQPDASEYECVLEHNRCAKSLGCPFKPQTRVPPPHPPQPLRGRRRVRRFATGPRAAAACARLD